METKKTNILFILADQWRFDAVGCNGNKVVKTPNIDGLGADGAICVRAYSANALCSPARASILTGLYPHHHGQLANTGNFNGVFDQQVLGKRSFMLDLKEQGYQTGYAGKFHLNEEGNGQQWGIDTWYTGHDYYASLKEKGYDYDIGRDEVQRLEWGGDAPFYGKAVLPLEDNHDTWVTDRTLEMIDDFSKGKEPFFLCAGFFGPHFPIVVPPPYDTMYDPEQVPKWLNFHEDFRNKPLIQQKELLRWNSAHLTWQDWQKVIACYWGFCTFLDDQIGRMVQALKEKGIYDNTLIVFTADHGDMLGSHRLFNKGFNMYEEDYHIPFIVKTPWQKRGPHIDAYMNLVDLAPTFLDAAGVQPKEMDGRTIMPLLRGEEMPGRDWAFAEFNGYESTLVTSRMIRNDKWKYIYNPFAEDELYDIQSDPGELQNLAPLLGFAHVLRRMREEMFRQLQRYDDGIVDQGSWQSNSYELNISLREQ